MKTQTKPQTLSLKFEDGLVRTIKLLAAKNRPKNLPYFKPIKGDYNAQIMGLFEWYYNLRTKHNATTEILNTAQSVIAQKMIEKTGGRVAVLEDTGECITYVDHIRGHYIVMMADLIERVIGDTDKGATISVQTI